MGFLDTLLGRTKPVQPKLDALFSLPTAAVTLQAAMGFTPTGTGSVCFRPAEGRAFHEIEGDVREGIRNGVNATPKFYVDGERIDGKFPLEGLEDAIRASIRAAGTD